METVIIVAGLSSSFAGSLILLSALSHQKEMLIKAFQNRQARGALMGDQDDHQGEYPETASAVDDLDLTPPRERVESDDPALTPINATAE